jgi:hypothetical protein
MLLTIATFFIINLFYVNKKRRKNPKMENKDEISKRNHKFKKWFQKLSAFFIEDFV